MHVYTALEKVQIIKWYYGGHSAQACVDLFSLTFQDRPVPGRQTIYDIVNNFEHSACLQNCSQCHKRNVSPEKEEARNRRDVDICSAVEVDDTRSSASIASELSVSQTTVVKTLKKYNFKSFKYCKIHELFPGDQFRRMEFCERVTEMANQDENFITNILFSDESSFALRSRHNPSRLRYWSKGNNHRKIVCSSQNRAKINVWTGILGDHIIGPYYIEGNLNAEKYVELLRERVIPAIQNFPDVNIENVWLQQDGCPAHNAIIVRHFLSNVFGDRLLSGMSNIKWPARSPDLAPMDFFFWGHIKSTIYGDALDKAENMDHLKEKISNAVNTVTRQMLENSRQAFYERLGYCLVQEGQVFEHLI
jgi:Helix-turn-helix domain (DUF4817)